MADKYSENESRWIKRETPERKKIHPRHQKLINTAGDKIFPNAYQPNCQMLYYAVRTVNWDEKYSTAVDNELSMPLLSIRCYLPGCPTTTGRPFGDDSRRLSPTVYTQSSEWQPLSTFGLLLVALCALARWRTPCIASHYPAGWCLISDLRICLSVTSNIIAEFPKKKKTFWLVLIDLWFKVFDFM